jgi:hypothetical protein
MKTTSALLKYPPARARGGRRPLTTLAALVLLLAVASAPRAAAAADAAYEPMATAGGSLADGDADKAMQQSPFWLPSGQGPLYSSTSTIVAALERWTGGGGAEEDSPAAPLRRRLSLLRLADPVALPAGSPQGSSSYGAHLTAVRFTDASIPAESKRRAVLSCSTHARELITGEACFAIVRLLAGAEPRSAGGGGGGANPSEPNPASALWRWREMRQAMLAAGLITRAEASSASASQAAFRARVAPRIARELDLAVLPVVNAAGRDVIEQLGNYTLRKTVDAQDPTGRPQVDPNRSYPYMWQGGPEEQPAEYYEASEVFPGRNPSWPWEVRATASLLDGSAAGEGAKRELDAAVDVHSGTHALLFPLGYTCDLSSVPQERIEHWQRASDAAVASIGPVTRGPTAPALYVAAGTTMEYAYGGLGAKMASTPEIWGPDGRNQRCPSMSEWAAACGAQEAMFGVCMCDGGLACESAADDDEAGQQQRQSSSSSSRGFAGGELTPWEVLREAQIMRAAGARAQADAAEADARRVLGLAPLSSTSSSSSSSRDAAAFVGGHDRDPGEDESAHYQPGKWPGGVAHGVDLADAIQMGEPVRQSGEQWFARDPYLRHWAKATPGQRRTFAFFNPTTAATYRRTVSDYATGILSMLLTA